VDIVELADRLWRGEEPTQKSSPLGQAGHLAEITTGVAFLANFGNCSVFDTDDGVVMVDTGSIITAKLVFEEVRSWSTKRLHSAVYSHGHIDHVFGVGPFDEEAALKKWPRPHVIAHHDVARRFERYVMTAGYNQVINRRQFALSSLEWPLEYRFPDETYGDEHTFVVGTSEFHLRHEKGETDDATVTWMAEKQVLCSGDLFIWNSPNAGNPQKVQRFPLEWAQALRRMAALEAEFLLPGHGLPIFGRARIAQALGETAEYLESLVAQTLALMNEGARLSDTISCVRVPSHLLDRPYLQPFYDEPEFIVRNIWRLYGGWWDGNPANLRPANDRLVASELCELAGGPAVLASRAEELANSGSEEELRLAGHLSEMAWLAAPDDVGIQVIRQQVFATLARNATSTMSRGVFRWAERDSLGDTH
jgi:alkyl sulfatase BDS1-like metallo-beta-lactamase superfamily hydrolase